MVYDAYIGENRRAMASFAPIGRRRMVFRFPRGNRPVVTAVANSGRILEPAGDVAGFACDLRVAVGQRKRGRRMVECGARQRLIRTGVEGSGGRRGLGDAVRRANEIGSGGHHENEKR